MRLSALHNQDRGLIFLQMTLHVSGVQLQGHAATGTSEESISGSAGGVPHSSKRKGKSAGPHWAVLAPVDHDHGPLAGGGSKLHQAPLQSFEADVS